MALAMKSFVLVIVSFLATALVLFLPAGTIAWPAGWIFLILLYGSSTACILMLLKDNPDLLRERLTFSRQDQKAWDKVLLPLSYLFYFVWLVLMALDAVRFHWSQMPLALQVIGTIVLISALPLMYLTFRENSFLSPMVRIQQERGQTVISTGPYHYVRHPLYSSGILIFLGSALLLGSWYGLLLCVVVVVGIAARAVMEERMLSKELPGYDAYMARVKYRLIPAIW